MNTENLNIINDMIKCININRRLAEQKKNPNRNGMIAALRDSLTEAPIAFMIFGLVTKHNIFTSFECFSNNDLYRKLYQYQRVLNLYYISKVAERI